MKNKLKDLARVVNENRVPIIRRTIIIGASVVAVTLTAGLIVKAPAAVEAVAELAE
jgi:hypothetical protein